MSAMASPHDVDPAVGAHVLPRAQDLLRSHTGQDEHDSKLVLQARVDRGAPDDPSVRRNAALDDLGDLLGLGDAHVVPACDVHEGSGRGADVDVDQGRIDRLFDRLLRTVVPVGLAQADHGHPAALHDRLDVVEVQVDEAGLRDDLRDPLDRAHQHIVRDLERRIQRQTRDEFKQFVIRDHDDRVREVPELLEAVLGVLGSGRSFGPERERADRDRQGACLLRQLREDRGAARAGPPSEAARDEDHVRPLDDGPEFVRGFAGGLLADLGERAGPKATRDPASKEELVGRPDDEEMLGVRVRGEELRPDDAGLDEPVDRVAAAPSDGSATVTIQRMTSTPTRAFSSEGSRRPTICFDLTPVATSMTRNVCSSDGSTVAPQMIRAVGETFDWTTSATRSASEIVMSFPPVTLISTPWAVDTSTSRSGELIASSIASTARLSPTAWLSPRPIIATPPPFMIVFTSLKSS